MPYDSRAIANYFLDLAERDHVSLDPMKIQKLVYFAHGWNLALIDKPLIEDKIEAWKWGPVIPTLYQSFKQFGSGPITKHATDWKIKDGKICLKTPSIDDYTDQENNDLTKALLERVWEQYGHLEGTQLSNMTHQDRTPWQITWAKESGRKGVDIDDALIKEYFQEELKLNAGRH